jgi:hypothetical protein
LNNIHGTFDDNASADNNINTNVILTAQVKDLDESWLDLNSVSYLKRAMIHLLPVLNDGGCVA